MTDFKSITVRAFDENNNPIFGEVSVPFRMGMSARESLEAAFVISQEAGHVDPIIYTLEFFGYSQSEQFPGYYGYEIESFFSSRGVLANNDQFYWELFICKQVSTHGADTTFPGPGDVVTWRYTPIGDVAEATPRAASFLRRRAVRRPT